MVQSSFQGFGPDGFEFLRGLAESQARDWFQAHKSTYETDLLAPMTSLLADLTTELTRRRIPLQADPRRSVFRIHRDVRFSKDKRPYKTHIGATLTRDGGKMSAGLVYVHVEPARSFAAAGFYRPEPPALGALRDVIATQPKAYRKVIAALVQGGLTLAADENALKRSPRGFEAIDAPDLAEALRRRSFLVRRDLPAEALSGPGMVPMLADFAQAALPLLQFGWAALGG